MSTDSTLSRPRSTLRARKRGGIRTITSREESPRATVSPPRIRGSRAAKKAVTGKTATGTGGKTTPRSRAKASPRVGAARKNSPARSRMSRKLASVRRRERKDHDPRTLLE